MAPALTETTNQAENFNLPFSPSSALSSPASPESTVTGTNDNLFLNIIDSGNNRNAQCVTKNKGLHNTETSKDALKKCQFLPKVIRAVHEIKKPHSCVKFNVLTGKKFVNCEKPSSGINLPAGDKHTSNLNLFTMNKDIFGVQDNMGLLNANVSFEKDMKNKVASLGHLQKTCIQSGQHIVFSKKTLGNGWNGTMTTLEKTYSGSDVSNDKVNDDKVQETCNFHLASVNNRNSACNERLQKRADYLLRRLRKTQLRQAQRHVERQLQAFVGYQQMTLGIPCQKQLQENCSSSKLRESPDIKSELFKNEDVKNLSTAALVNLVKKLESWNRSSKLWKGNKHQDACSIEHVDLQLPQKDKVSVKYNIEEKKEIRRASGTLSINLKHLETAFDSDKTESSSGGESCDENEGFGDPEHDNLQEIPIHRRAGWKWTVDRSGVASRWTWLQAQVSDLEYKIRQQGELHRKLRAAKGCFSLGIPGCSSGNDNATTKNPGRSGRKLTPIEVKIANIERRNELTAYVTGLDKSSENPTIEVAKKRGTSSFENKQVNGFVDSSVMAKNKSEHGTTVPLISCPNSSPLHPLVLTPVIPFSQFKNASDSKTKKETPSFVGSTCQASRTRPLMNFNKRKIFKISDLHQTSRKASRLSSVRCACSCQREMLPCIVCGGLFNNTQSFDPNTTPISERIALLDPSFHQVLSFPQDTDVLLQFDAFLKSAEFQKSVMKASFIRKKCRLPAPSKNCNEHNRNRNTKLTKSAAQALLTSAKYRKKLGEKKPRKKKSLNFENGDNSKWKKKRTFNELGYESFKRRRVHRPSSSASSSSSKTSSPAQSPAPVFDGDKQHGSFAGNRASQLQDVLKKRKHENEYDINNIVIPYSIAATTRVERLQYKEILTPKWRITNEEPPSYPMNSGPVTQAEKDQEEDVSEMAFTLRHQRCEEAEKRRFLNYMQVYTQGRSRSRGTRLDCRAESSGANTPDPMFPNPPDFMCQDSNSLCITSPVSSPPPLLFSDDSQLSGGPIAAPKVERRRTISVTKQDDVRMGDVEEPEIQPYKPRVFPLNEEELYEMLNESKQPKELTQVPRQVNFLLEAISDSPTSPLSSSGSSLPEEDPNDPEWTVLSSEKNTKQSLVLKFAKR